MITVRAREIFKVRKTTKIRKQYNQVPHLTQDTTWESNKNTINITNKRSALSQQVTTRQQWTDAKAWEKQDTKNANDPKSHSVPTSAKKMTPTPRAVHAIHFGNRINCHLVLNRAKMRLSNSMQLLTRKYWSGHLCTHLSLHLKLKVTCVYICDS